MLKNIPNIISPDLMHTLMSMGHGDTLVIGDCNFAAESYGKRTIRLDGHNNCDILDAIMQFFPLDQFVENPVILMKPKDNSKIDIWEKYRNIINKHENSFKEFEYIDRFDFYERAKNAYACIATGETSIYACLIITKGVIII